MILVLSWDKEVFFVPLYTLYWVVELLSWHANRSTCLPKANTDPSNPTGSFVTLHCCLDKDLPLTEKHSSSGEDKWSAMGNANFLSLFHDSNCVLWTQMEVCSTTWFKSLSFVTTCINLCWCSAILDASIKYAFAKHLLTSK